MVAGRSERIARDHLVERLASEGCEVITAGFPCQDISLAGAGAGLAGARSGLVWPLMRTIRLVRPRVAFLENVAALLARGLGDILGHLATVGYDAEWHCVPASAVGAPHQRDRVWIVATEADREPIRQQQVCELGRSGPSITQPDSTVADSDNARLEGRGCAGVPKCACEWTVGGSCSQWRRDEGWQSEPDVGRVADGVPARVDRLTCLGNAVVPACVEFIAETVEPLRSMTE